MRVPDEWYNEEDLNKAAKATQKILQDGQAKIEMSLITKSGQTIPTEYIGASIKDVECGLHV